MGSAQGKVAAITRSGNGNQADDAISISSGSPSPSPRRLTRAQKAALSRVDRASGRIQKITSPRPGPYISPPRRKPSAPKKEIVTPPAIPTGPGSSLKRQIQQRSPSPQRQEFKAPIAPPAIPTGPGSVSNRQRRQGSPSPRRRGFRSPVAPPTIPTGPGSLFNRQRRQSSPSPQRREFRAPVAPPAIPTGPGSFFNNHRRQGSPSPQRRGFRAPVEQRRQRSPSPQRPLIQHDIRRRRKLDSRSGAWGVSKNDPAIPFGLDNKLFRAIQTLVEHGLYHWANQWISIVLSQSGWKVPEHAELNWWIRAMSPFARRVEDALADSKARLTQQRLFGLIESLHDVRHAAVHRHSIPLPEVLIKLDSAIDLMSRLGDEARACKLISMENTLEIFDMEKLDEVLEKPLKEFANHAASMGPPGVGGREPTPKMSARVQVVIPAMLGTNLPEQKQVGYGRLTRSNSPIGTTAERKDPENKDGLLRAHGVQALPSVKREFGSGRENMQHGASNIQQGGRTSLPNNLSSYAFIDLTEDGEQSHELIQNKALNTDSNVLKREPTNSKKRLFAEFEADYIEISDDDEGAPDDDEPDEGEDTMVFSYVPRPTMGVDY